MSHTVMTRERLAALTMAALGVVYGDIGTSPLYALRECFISHTGRLEVNPANVLGVLSLIIWSLFIVVTYKYIGLVMRADNKGEGGILALLSLAFPERGGESGTRLGTAMILFGLFGATLLYGDGIITPAISVLGAMEGLKEANPNLAGFIVPVAVVVIIALFAAQRFGTAHVGRWFGRWTLVWFLLIGILGIRGIFNYPAVLSAFSPHHAISFFTHHGWAGLKVMSAVVLVVTGGEALYADMGHFGARPIRIAWFAVVLPSLLLNYLGQGALLITQPDAIDNPFYGLCPKQLLYPTIVVATGAAIIASQALISGAFSLTMHATQLGFMPRMAIEHTSETERGQIYMPHVNWMLMIACLGLVLGFRSSAALASTYGIAVTITMAVTSVLMFFAARRLWKWSVAKAALALCIPFGFELLFAAANVVKIPHGGWFPLLIALIIFTVMSTWKRGRQLLWNRIRNNSLPAEDFIASLGRRQPARVSGTAVYMAGNSDGTPIALLHNLKHNKVLHERVVFLTVGVEDTSHVDEAQRVDVRDLGSGFFRVRGSYGFMEEPDVQSLLNRCALFGLTFKEHETTFFVSRETIIPSRLSGMATWREHLFAVLARNAQSATAFFRLPPNRVVELGMQVEI